MVQWLILNLIDAKSAAPAVSGQHYLIPHPPTHKTKSALSFIQFAKARTKPALDAPIRQHHPPLSDVIRLCLRGNHSHDSIFSRRVLSSKYAIRTNNV